LWLMLVLAGALGGLSGWVGGAVSAASEGKPTGAVVVLTAGGLFVVSMVCAPRRGVISALLRRVSLRVRVAVEHLLEELYEHERRGGDGARSAVFGRATVRRLGEERGWSGWFRGLIVRYAALRGELAVEDGAVRLTERGRRSGARVSRNHRLWEQYLLSYADIAPGHVDYSVDQVEHVLSEELVEELEAALSLRGGAVAGGGR